MNEYPETIFSPQLVHELGSIGTVLGEFLDHQITRIQQALLTAFPQAPTDAVDKLLNVFVTLEGTKRPLHQDQIQLPFLNKESVKLLLNELEKSRILRYEDEHYELAHDTLAHRIAERRSSEEIAFLEVRKLVKDRYNLYPTTSTLLNASELQLIRTYEQRLKEENILHQEEWAYIKRSIRENQRRRIYFGLSVASIILVLAVFSIFSYRQSVQAKMAQQQAEYSLQQLEEEQQQRTMAQYQGYLERGRALMAQSNFEGAIQEFNIALSYQPEGQEALNLKKESNTKLEIRTQFDQFVEEGDRFYEAGANSYVDALEKYRAALNLSYNNSLAENKINTVSGKLETAYDQFLKNGDTFYKVGGYQYALNNYRQALRIKPENSELRQKVANCRKRLNE